MPGLKGDWDSGNDKLNNPADAALDPRGSRLLAVRWHRARPELSTRMDRTLATLDNRRHAGTGWGCPTGVALAPRWYLYVTDPCSQRVQTFDRNLL